MLYGYHTHQKKETKKKATSTPKQSDRKILNSTTYSEEKAEIKEVTAT